MLFGKQKAMTCFVVAALIAAALVLPAGAQARKRDNKPTHAVKPAEERHTPSVSLVERAPADYLSGEANVAVSGNQNPVIKLGLSPNGATIIEFPASDKLFNIIPGNSNLVTVEESPTKETDRFVIVRPGDGFGSPTTMALMRRAPASSVIVQMTSGLVVTFLFYPVPQLAEQAHRVVVTYDRNEVIATRRAAGLAVNLDSAGEDKTRSTASLRIATPLNAAKTVGAGASQPPEKLAEKLAETPELNSQPVERPDQKKTDLYGVAGQALSEAIKSPDSFKNWGDSAHGLSISTSPVREVDERSQMIVIAVRNSKNDAARVVPGQPEIYVETSPNARLVTVDPIRKLAVQTTATEGLIPGKGTAYYAVVYEAPILGARQQLRVAVGKTTAADEPAVASLNVEKQKGRAKNHGGQ
jgi:hypothetical protein